MPPWFCGAGRGDQARAVLSALHQCCAPLRTALAATSTRLSRHRGGDLANSSSASSAFRLHDACDRWIQIGLRFLFVRRHQRRARVQVAHDRRRPLNSAAVCETMAARAKVFCGAGDSAGRHGATPAHRCTRSRAALALAMTRSPSPPAGIRDRIASTPLCGVFARLDRLSARGPDSMSAACMKAGPMTTSASAACVCSSVTVMPRSGTQRRGRGKLSAISSALRRRGHHTRARCRGSRPRRARKSAAVTLPGALSLSGSASTTCTLRA